MPKEKEDENPEVDFEKEEEDENPEIEFEETQNFHHSFYIPVDAMGILLNEMVFKPGGALY